MLLPAVNALADNQLVKLDARERLWNSIIVATIHVGVIFLTQPYCVNVLYLRLLCLIPETCYLE